MKSKIALFFSLLFLGIIASPTIIHITGNDQYVLLDLGEEEENKGKEPSESKIDSEIEVFNYSNTKLFQSYDSLNSNLITFLCKNYISQSPNISTPPPKFEI